jgi:hypothetical protein
MLHRDQHLVDSRLVQQVKVGLRQIDMLTVYG